MSDGGILASRNELHRNVRNRSSDLGLGSIRIEVFFPAFDEMQFFEVVEVLQDDLDGAFSLGRLCFSDDTVGASSECLAKLVLGSVVAMLVGDDAGSTVLDGLLVIAVGLAVEFVEHAGDYVGDLVREMLGAGVVGRR